MVGGCALAGLRAQVPPWPGRGGGAPSRDNDRYQRGATPTTPPGSSLTFTLPQANYLFIRPHNTIPSLTDDTGDVI